jgi:stress response protein SCP2
VVAAVSIDGATMSDVGGLQIIAIGAGLPIEVELIPDLGDGSVLVFAEIDRTSAGWRLRALHASHQEGLSGLARDVGVDIE